MDNILVSCDAAIEHLTFDDIAIGDSLSIGRARIASRAVVVLMARTNPAHAEAA